MKPLHSFSESCNCRLNITFSVEVSMKKLVANESNSAQVEFREKQGQLLFSRNLAGEGLARLAVVFCKND